MLGNAEVSAQEDEIQKYRNKRRKAILIASCLVAVLGVALLAHGAYAQSEGSKALNLAVNWVLGIAAKVFIWLMEMLGRLVLVSVRFLVSVVQYNNFVKAVPVQIGWPLFRDTINMFFIIVVLVSAFATIIGYPEDLRYKKVLPKLLLMAVLINFSKTLIGLMIDFSQVIVLTFVNGFKQIAGSNIINALNIGKIMKINDSFGQVKQDGNELTVELYGNPGMEAQPFSMMNILIAAIFGCWILAITLTLLLIMIIFFLGRVIILWFLLITSPAAFFVWALPGKLQAGMSQFSSEWWKRLSAALVGGPVMAFFLWLALAMGQQGGNLVGPGGLYDTSEESSELSTQQQQATGNGMVVVTEFGDPKIYANFVIMVAFLLIGVQTAIQFSQQAAPQLGKLAGAMRGAGGIPGAPTRLAIGAAKVGARGVAKGAKLATRVGKRYDLGGKTARYMLQKGLVPTKTGRLALAKIGSEAAREGVSFGGELRKSISTLPPDMQEAMYRDYMSSGNVRESIGGANALASLVTGGAYIKQEKARRLAQLEKQNPNADKEELKTLAHKQTMDHVSNTLTEVEKKAMDHNDEETLKKIKEAREKNPNLLQSGRKRIDQALDDATDMQSERRIDPSAFMDAQYALRYAYAHEWIDEDGRPTVKAQNDPEYVNFMKGKQGQIMNGHFEYARSSDAAKKQVRQIITGTNEKGEKLSGAQLDTMLAAQNYTINVSRDGESWHAIQGGSGNIERGRFDRKTSDPNVIMKNASSTQRASIEKNISVLGQITTKDESGKTITRDVQVSDLGKELPAQVVQTLSDDLEALADPATIAAAASRGYDMSDMRAEVGKNNLQHGVSMEALYGFNKENGTFNDNLGRESFEKTVGLLLDEIQSDNYSTETVNAMQSLLEQMGNQGQAMETVSKIVADRMQSGALQQSQVLNLLSAGDDKKQLKGIRTGFMNINDMAKRDDESGKTGTVHQGARDQVMKIDTTDRKTASVSSKVRNILYHGK
ncbi:MAG: hypothetical protein ACOYUZ_01045 [Patescibacteria group bacterium]